MQLSPHSQPVVGGLIEDFIGYEYESVVSSHSPVLPHVHAPFGHWQFSGPHEHEVQPHLEHSLGQRGEGRQ